MRIDEGVAPSNPQSEIRIPQWSDPLTNVRGTVLCLSLSPALFDSRGLLSRLELSLAARLAEFGIGGRRGRD